MHARDPLRGCRHLAPPCRADKCYDDHQWWLLGWVRAYEATGNVSYIQRAAEVFDYVAAHAWTPQCGGGVLWVREDRWGQLATLSLTLTLPCSAP